MRLGETVQVVKGSHEGKQALIKSTAGFFYNLQLLTPGGRKAADGLVTLHRSAIAPLRESVESRG